jgi:hypothetical protein
MAECSAGRRLYYDLSSVPADFDHEVYLVSCRHIVDISALNQSMKHEEHELVLPTLREHVHVVCGRESGDADTTVVWLKMDDTCTLTKRNLLPGDEVRIDRCDPKSHAIIRSMTFLVLEVDYELLEFKVQVLGRRSATSAFFQGGGESVYELYGHWLFNPRRLAVINFIRGARSLSGSTSKPELGSFDVDFNAELYKLLYPDARGMTNVEAYGDYIAKKGGGDVRIGSVHHLSPSPLIEDMNQSTLEWASNISRSALSRNQWTSNALSKMQQTMVSEYASVHHVAREVHNTESRLLDTVASSFVNKDPHNQNVSISGNLTVASNLSVHGSTTLHAAPNSSVALDVEGAVRARDYLVKSDQRTKTSVQALSTSENLADIMMLNAVQFQYKQEPHSSAVKYGFIAQELERIDPHLVQTTSDYLPNILESAFVDQFGRVSLSSSDRLVVGDKLKVMVSDGNSRRFKELITSVRAKYDDAIVIENSGGQLYQGTHMFYGTLTHDFKSIDIIQVIPKLVAAVQAIASSALFEHSRHVFQTESSRP